MAEPAATWEAIESYRKGKEAINLPIVYDAAEKALGMATDANTAAASKSEEKLQALYKIIRGVREKLSANAISTENVTKKSLPAVDYDWN